MAVTHEALSSPAEQDPVFQFVADAARDYITRNCVDLPFHSPTHTFDDVLPAYDALTGLAYSRGRIGLQTKKSGRYSVVGHDLDPKSVENSAQLLARMMTEAGCSGVEITSAIGYVMESEAELTDYTIAYPRIITLTGAYVADADLAHWAGPWGVVMDRARAITEELSPGYDFSDPVAFRSFVLNEWRLRRNHVWQTEEADELFGPGFDRNLRRWDLLASQYQIGRQN